MIVFDLHCEAAGHVFEAWFGSTADYESQRARKLVACPFCGDSAVSKAVMAPNVSAKGNSRVETANVPAVTGDPEGVKAMLAALAKAQAAMLEKSDWVGSRFADQARAMHLGEVDRRSIHGQATVEEAKEMIEEGIELAALPFPVLPPEAHN